MKKYLGFDFGASSGRAVVGIVQNSKLTLDEIYRFENGGIVLFKSFYWDVLRLYQKIKKGLEKCVEKYGSDIESIGIDSWGVDFALLDDNDELVGLMHHYRDRRTDNMFNEMFKKVPKEEIFRKTGIQFMFFNTSLQLFSMVFNKSPQLSIVKTILLLPDYLNFLLSGKKKSEFSIATTTQLYNPTKKNWAFDLIRELGLNPDWFCEIIQPATVLGNIQEYIAKEVGLNDDIQIIVPACHDTGSAVAAVPARMNAYKQGEWAYLSSGTWSLLGVELSEPLINEKVFEYNFTNEGGVNGTIRFLKNITGLWIIQECKRIWDKKDLNLSWDDIMERARNARPFQAFIDPSVSCFDNPHDMISEIKNYCQNSSQKPPESVGEISRTIFESLAFKYKQVLELLEELSKIKVKILHIIGGGSQNTLLNQFTANALNIPVETGPVEATVIGNILLQAMATKQIASIQELREIVRNSFNIKKYEPVNIADWQKGYETYLEKI